ncbi:MAG: class I SAM-dependent methyltransferase [Gaiellaceae bacterium]
MTHEDEDTYIVNNATLEFLVRRLAQSRPQALLEFGSGRSTVAFAALMADLHADTRARVFSIDEDARYLEQTRKRLEDAGLSDRVRLAHRPVCNQTVMGERTRCYDLSDEFLAEFLELPVEVIFVDGPSGGGNVRLATLPSVIDRVQRPCVVFLDDALRDDEIAVAQRWARIPGVRLRGVHVIGAGLLEGQLIT